MIHSNTQENKQTYQQTGVAKLGVVGGTAWGKGKQATKEDFRNISQTYRSAVHKANALLEMMFTGDRKTNQES